MNMTETLDQASEARLLTNAELDDVNGGLLWLAGLFAAGFAVGWYLAGPTQNNDLVLPALGT